MSTPRGTTPTYILTFSESSNIDLTLARHVYVTFKSIHGKVILTKSDEDLIIESKSISVYLTQKETLSFFDTMRMQANWTYENGSRGASAVQNLRFTEQLLDKEVE